MEKLELDVGLVEYAIGGGGTIRFHPADPGLYGRFVEAEAQLAAIEAELTQKGQTADPQSLLLLMREADDRAKALLNQVFGPGNDFHKALGGVSLLAVCADGKSVAEKLFKALGTVLEQGAQRLVETKLNALRKQP